MDISTVSAMNDHLRQVLATTSDWDDDQLGDEDMYGACDKLRTNCVSILLKLDSLLDDEGDGDKYEEERSVSNGEVDFDEDNVCVIT